jgi:activator of 2-hydroxyglutaryl-CoA dehydratase
MKRGMDDMRLGIDVGSTTVKVVLLNEQDETIYQKYERHMSSVFDKVKELLQNLMEVKGNIPVQVVITGSGGLSLSEKIGAKFEQEVVTCSLAVEKIIPQTDVAIELGGGGCQDYLFWQKCGTENEWNLRRGYRRFHRSDGYFTQYRWRRIK